MYMVVQVNAGRVPSLGQLLECSTWVDAVDVVVKLALEQTDVPEEEIRHEVEHDGDFADPNGGFSICIGTPKDHRRKRTSNRREERRRQGKQDGK